MGRLEILFDHQRYDGLSRVVGKSNLKFMQVPWRFKGEVDALTHDYDQYCEMTGFCGCAIVNLPPTTVTTMDISDISSSDLGYLQTAIQAIKEKNHSASSDSPKFKLDPEGIWLSTRSHGCVQHHRCIKQSEN